MMLSKHKSKPNHSRKGFLFFVALTAIIAFVSCSHNFKKACIDVDIVRNGKAVTIDSCFTAPTRDSLEKMIAIVRMKQADPHERYDTRILFMIVDTLQKTPDEYVYALVVSNAGTIDPEVVVTKDISVVKERSDVYAKTNVIPHKLKIGETIKGEVEAIFKTNIRINWRREGNRKVNL